MISKLVAQRNLLICWGVGTLLFVAIAITQQAGQKFGKDSDAFWDWFLPNFIPTLTLIGGSYVALVQQGDPDNKQIDKGNYWLCFWIMVLYFALMLLIFGLMSYAIDKSENKLTPLEHLRNYSKIIVALHSLVTLMLGIFFAKEKSTGTPAGNKAGGN
ncbi:hypothetical protein [Emticicia sp. 17c]|uniref:hypothetical protein n=1 Tax=Emticicia sp. 17c TaxID=3127704 RepID=UPI00301BE894